MRRTRRRLSIYRYRATELDPISARGGLNGWRAWATFGAWVYVARLESR